MKFNCVFAKEHETCGWAWACIARGATPPILATETAPHALRLVRPVIKEYHGLMGQKASTVEQQNAAFTMTSSETRRYQGYQGSTMATEGPWPRPRKKHSKERQKRRDVILLRKESTACWMPAKKHDGTHARHMPAKSGSEKLRNKWYRTRSGTLPLVPPGTTTGTT